MHTGELGQEGAAAAVQARRGGQDAPRRQGGAQRAERQGVGGEGGDKKRKNKKNKKQTQTI